MRSLLVLPLLMAHVSTYGQLQDLDWSAESDSLLRGVALLDIMCEMVFTGHEILVPTAQVGT